MSGILLSVLNPTWLIWWATIGVAFVVWSARYGTMGPVYFYTGHIVADFSWYSMVSFMVGRGRNISQSLHRILLIGSGLFMAVMGGYFVWQGMGFWVDRFS
ncbi:MAG: LysE family transporter [Chloroflexi bacterium]|nr:LysE family transporter [Chloroflexota bacterium]